MVGLPILHDRRDTVRPFASRLLEDFVTAGLELCSWVLRYLLPASLDCEPLPAAPAESDSVCSRYFDDAIFRHVHGAAVDQIKC